MYRHHLTSEQWDAVKSEFPPDEPTGGRPRRPARDVLGGVLWVLHTGSPWRDLPREFGSWQTAHRYFTRWSRDGTIERVVRKLQMRLRDAGRIRSRLWCADGTSIRASQAAAGAGKRGEPASPGTTHWDAPGAAGEPSSISSATKAASP